MFAGSRVRSFLVLVGALFLWPIRADAGIKNDLRFILAHNPPAGDTGKTFIHVEEREQINEVEFILHCTIRFYQLFISSQDDPGCNFTPGCSRYAMQALQKYGLLYGGLMCADRLLRCNGLGHEHNYPMHPQTGRFADPVEANYLWNE